MRGRGAVRFITLAVCGLAAAEGVQAGIVTDLFEVVGPGLGIAHVIEGKTAGFNDDNVGAALDDLFNQQDIHFNFLLAVKAFESLGPIDVVFEVSNSGGTTEYLLAEGVFNFSGERWSDYHFQLGFGAGEAFVLSEDDGLDFDTPHRDPQPEAVAADFTTPVFATLEHADDAIEWSGGAVPSSESLFDPGLEHFVLFGVSFDTPDDHAIPSSFRTVDGYRLTLRQFPTTSDASRGGPVVAEPGTLALLGLGLASFGLRPRRRRP